MNIPSSTSILLTLSTSLLVGYGTAQSDRPDIVEIATKAGQFKTLTAALGAAGLVEALQGDGPLTVLAPTDKAFAKLPKGTVEGLLKPENRDQLTRILKFHVVSGNIDAAAALAAGSAEALSGDTLKFSLERGALTVNGARVIDNDIRARNGIIHVIDTVLLPPAPSASSPAKRAMGLIELAVERGIPLFNDGNPQACADVYEVTTRALVSLGRDQLPPAAIKPLEEALKRMDSREGAQAKAWTLRGGLDRAYAELSAKSDRQPAEKKKGLVDAKTVFGFDGNDTARWFTLNDDVMGGVSKSAFKLTDRGSALFAGALSLDNNGGFATIRSSSADLGLGGYDTLVARVKGDGRSYGLHAMPTSRRGGVNYWAAKIDTVDGEWTEVAIPISSMKRTIMGQRVPFGGQLSPGKIRSLAFMIADKDTSPFNLEIDWIKAVNSNAGVAAD